MGSIEQIGSFFLGFFTDAVEAADPAKGQGANADDECLDTNGISERVIKKLSTSAPNLYKFLSQRFEEEFGKTGYKKCTLSKPEKCTEPIFTFDDYIRFTTEVYLVHHINCSVVEHLEDLLFYSFANFGFEMANDDPSKKFEEVEKGVFSQIPMMLRTVEKSAYKGPEPAVQYAKAFLCTTINKSRDFDSIYNTATKVWLLEVDCRQEDESTCRGFNAYISSLEGYVQPYYNSYGFDQQKCLEKIAKADGDMKK